jgi:hypothetical protein
MWILVFIVKQFSVSYQLSKIFTNETIHEKTRTNTKVGVISCDFVDRISATLITETLSPANLQVGKGYSFRLEEALSPRAQDTLNRELHRRAVPASKRN